MSSAIKLILVIVLAVILLPLALKIFFALLGWTLTLAFKLAILALIVIGAMTVISRLLKHA